MSHSDKNTDQNTPADNQSKSPTMREVLYSFRESGKGNWRVQDDVVMGGRSDSQLQMTPEMYAQFSGRVSLENNGGFCSIHQTTEKQPYKISETSTAFLVRLNGDGKDYNFRVKTPNGRHSYAFTFPTKGDGNWETIAIPFNKMEATYRGETVDVPTYKGEPVLEMQLLIGNKKEETFELLMEAIGVN